MKAQFPDGGFRIVFDTVCLIFIVWEIVLIPLLLSFPEINDESIHGIETTITAFFLFDIILNFNTGFYQRGNLVLKRRAIAENYLKNWFMIGKFFECFRNFVNFVKFIVKFVDIY